MHSGEPDPIFLAPQRPRKGPGKLAPECLGCHVSSSCVQS